jgi:CheY-like chemotaxis protein
MNTDQLKVIFVDDESRILDGLRRQLHAFRQQWDMRFAQSGEEALKMLAALPADVVVSDMRMPGMTGGQLHKRILATYPRSGLARTLGGMGWRGKVASDRNGVFGRRQFVVDVTSIRQASHEHGRSI